MHPHREPHTLVQRIRHADPVARPRFTGGLALPCLFACLCFVPPTESRAQTKPTASSPSAAPASDKKDDPIALSPFEVSAGSDSGYAVRETLAGTRFKSELKDVPSQVSVMTKEFLEDISSVTIEDAYRYSPNVENLGEYTSTVDMGNNPRAYNRIRGLSVPGTTHDFFPTRVRQDTYNTEWVSISSGPNAILFGNSNAGGVVDAAFSRANVQRPRHTVSFRHDNYGSERVALDLNQPLLKDRLALRLAGVRSRENHWRKPAGRDDDRYYGTVTFKQFPTTTLRIYGEDVWIDEALVRNNRTLDSVTPWIKAGRPAFDNGLNAPMTVTAANNGLFVRNTNSVAVMTLGAAQPVAMQAWGSPGAASPAAAGTRYSVHTIGAGSSPNQTGIDVYNYSLPFDETISPFAISAYGLGVRQATDARITGAALEQRLPLGFFLEAAYNRESTRQPNWSILSNVGLRADANLYLPDRITPNPNFGRYYLETNSPLSNVYRYESRESRLMLSRDLDFSARSGWRQWIGRHRLAAMYQRSENMDVFQSLGSRLIPANVTSDRDVIDRYTSFPQALFRFYLSDPSNPATGTKYHLEMPFDPVRTTVFTLPDGSRYAAGDKSPFGGAAGATMNNNRIDSRVFAMQSYLLKSRLVTSFGVRSDRTRQASLILQRKTSSPTAAFPTVYEFDPPRNWSIYRSGTTRTAGAVGHVLPWLSVFYNQSNTWNPPTVFINPVNGSRVAGSIGDGRDYGVMLRLFQDRLSLRLNRYRNTAGPAIAVGFRDAILPTVRNIERTLNQAAQDGRIASRPATAFYDPELDTYAQNTLTSEQVSTGEEFELTFNPSRHWRIALNGTRGRASQSNIGREWFEFIRQRAPVWEANSSLTGPDTVNTSIGTYYLSLIQTLNLTQQSDGQRVENGREWRANLVTRYTFPEGRLRGAFVGGGYRWRSAQVLGYRSELTENAFKFAGAPQQVVVPVLARPISGEPLEEIEAFLGYSRRLARRIEWRIQLNIRNLFDQQDPIGQRANLATGAVSIYTVPEPRSFILANTFTF